MSLAVHHLNCATMAPALTAGGRVAPARMVAHCLVVETADRLVLVDTGFGTGDLAHPKRRLGVMLPALRPALDPAETALAQLRELGHKPGDVSDIVLTHLDADHAGGLGDFPQARVHVHADELAAARHRRTPKQLGRYAPAQWAHHPDWQEHPVTGEDWLGFAAVHVVSDDLLLVPLLGHTRGHSGVAVRRPSGGWFLHAGDAYFVHGEKDTPPSCPSGLTVFQNLMQVDRGARLANAARLRTLHAEHGPDTGAPEPVTVFSAHDASEYDALAGVTD